MILPFTPIVPLDTNTSDMLPGYLAVGGGPDMSPIQVSVDNIEGYCMDGFNFNLYATYLKDLFKRQESLTNSTASFWLNRNTPYITGNNLTGAVDKFADLPYYPGDVNPSYQSLPENAIHRYIGGLKANFYVRARFGSEFAT